MYVHVAAIFPLRFTPLIVGNNYLIYYIVCYMYTDDGCVVYAYSLEKSLRHFFLIRGNLSKCMSLGRR